MNGYLVRNRQDRLFQSHAGHTSGLADDLRAVYIIAIRIGKLDEILGELGIIGHILSDRTLPP